MLKKILFTGIVGLSMIATNGNASDQVAYPSVSLGAQSGYGLNAGTAYIAGGAIESTPHNNRVSGALAAGIGFGNSKESVGLQVDLVLASADPTVSGFAGDGFFNAKLHKIVSDLSSISIGVENIGSWGKAKQDNASHYVAYSHIFLLPKPLSVSVGVGDGRFADALSNNKVGVFASMAYDITSQFTVIADYTGGVSRAGISFVPVASAPISVTMYADDLSKKYDRTKFAMNLAYIMHF